MAKVSQAELARVVKQLIYPFLQIERKTPFRFAPGRHENDAEHSWSLALFACAFAPLVDPSLDTGKVAEYAIVHDLLEVYTGDIPNFSTDEEKALKVTKEADALKRMQADYTQFPWIAQTVTAYEDQTSAEARFVKATDKFLPLLCDVIDEGLIFQENKVTLEEWKAYLAGHREKAKADERVFEYYKDVWDELVSHPEFYYRS